MPLPAPSLPSVRDPPPRGLTPWAGPHPAGSVVRMTGALAPAPATPPGGWSQSLGVGHPLPDLGHGSWVSQVWEFRRDLIRGPSRGMRSGEWWLQPDRVIRSEAD